jgi:hypothetical protein
MLGSKSQKLSLCDNGYDELIDLMYDTKYQIFRLIDSVKVGKDTRVIFMYKNNVGWSDKKSSKLA